MVYMGPPKQGAQKKSAGDAMEQGSRPAFNIELSGPRPFLLHCAPWTPYYAVAVAPKRQPSTKDPKAQQKQGAGAAKRQSAQDKQDLLAQLSEFLPLAHAHIHASGG